MFTLAFLFILALTLSLGKTQRFGGGSPPPEPKSLRAEYDFIVVGGGTAGCVVAARLSERSDWNVLVLEAGDDESAAMDVPILASYVVLSPSTWPYMARKDDRFCRGMEGGRCRWTRGKVLGGSSVINYMIYSRGAPSDYNAWADSGLQGWSYQDVLPYFKKSEDALLQDGLEDGLFSPVFRSQRGPLPVRHVPWRSPLAPLFMQAAQDWGLPHRDTNGGAAVGVGYVQAMVKDGLRYSAARAFLYPRLVRGRPNLHVVRRAHVTRILIDPFSNRAVGVEFVKASSRQKRQILATREVILSAGTINSPQLLMLSGVGNRSHLESFGIPVVVDLPAVGSNLQDHVAFAGIAFTVNESVTVVESRVALNPLTFLDYVINRQGVYTLPGGSEVTAYLQSPVAEGDAPDLELVFGPGALNGDSRRSLRRTLNIREDMYRRVWGLVEGRDAWSVTAVLLRPKSRGKVLLHSADPFQAPDMHANYYDHEQDLHTLVRGIQAAVWMGQSPALQRYGSSLLKAPVPGCESLPFGSDAYWGCAIRQVGVNLHHQVGTCSMGVVVDQRLRVFGIRGLRVVDASVMPSVPSGHTAAPVYMIAEKAADMIKEEWSPIDTMTLRYYK